MSSFYRIGAVSKLTGVPTTTIRTWERRYGAFAGQQATSGGHRRYSEADVEKVRLLRALTERGEAIGELAPLDVEDLQARLATNAAARQNTHQKSLDTLTIGVLHRTLAVLWPATSAKKYALELAWNGTDLEKLLAALAQQHFDAVVCELELLEPEADAALSRLTSVIAPSRLLITAQFLRSSWKQRWADKGVRFLSGALAVDAVFEALNQVPPRAMPEFEIQSPKYSTAELAALRLMDSSVACECPHHLATLLEQLTAFEAYSQRCASQSPEDAALHRELAAGTAAARMRMEALLEQVLEHDGINLSDIKKD